MKSLGPEEKLLLSCVKIHANKNETAEINALIPLISNWDTVIKNLIAHGSAPLFFKKISGLSNKELIPDPIKELLQQTYYRSLSRGMLLYDAFGNVARALQSNGIEIVVLKGIYLSEWLYGDIALRQFSDMDLLVREEDGQSCLDILSQLGFKPYDTPVSEFIGAPTEIVHFTPMVKGDISVEIHIRLHHKSQHYRIITSKFIENAIPVTLNHIPVHALQLNDLIIHLCVHLDKHFSGGHVQMKCFNDIVNLIDQYGDTIDWVEFVQNCHLHACEETVFKYLMMVQHFYPVHLPAAIQQQFTPLLTERDKEQFMQFLHGKEIRIYHVTTHWANIKEITGIIKKIRYFTELIFPPKSFMVKKYKIKHPRWYGLWYPYRWGVGIKGILKLVRG